jgi:hypothetical protein
MIDIKHKRCIEPNCNILPCYNFKCEKKALYCNKHKKDNMVDIINKTCIEPNCDIQPVYNFQGEKKALYCNKHKKDNMVDVKNKRCIEPNCDIQPVYNFQDEKIPLYCNKHKKDNMVDVKNKRCIKPNCNIQPNYNFQDEKIPLYCNKHKKDNMVDIKNKTCIEPNCETRSTYNFQDEKIPLYCNKHKKDNMVDIIHKTCKLENCPIRGNRKYKGYCLRCFIYTFPDEKVSRNYKTKEKHVVDYIIENFKNNNWNCDKTIQGGCSKRRPDMFLELDEQCIIVEIDENQHFDYDCSCENKRLMELSQDIGHKPIIFIRFNPDDYIENCLNIKSCFGPGKDGILRIKKNKEKEWKERLNILKNQIEYWLKPENKTEKTIETVHLFYDN